MLEKNFSSSKMFRATLKAALFFIAGLGLTAGALPGPVFGQVDLRSTFPGRRVGGGTRGECSARTLAHLVPINSVYSPGTSGDLGLVQGPTANPVSLTMTFIPNSGGGVESSRILDAASVGLILVRGAGIDRPTIWESNFDCNADDQATSADPLSFIETVSPPAISLLLPQPEPSDVSVQNALMNLRQNCGSTVPAQATLAQFGLADLLTKDWPTQLPVHCPS
jgi:hypothetical protein